MTLLLAHYSKQALSVVFGRRRVDEVALLLGGSEFGIALVNDQMHQRIAHILGRKFQDFFPFSPALEFTELNFRMRRVGVDRIELVALGDRWIEADIFLPLAKEVHPIIEGCDSFRHDFLLLSLK